MSTLKGTGADPRSAGSPTGRRTVAVLTHSRPAQTADALDTLIGAAGQAGVRLCFDAQETAKHALAEREGIPEHVALGAAECEAADLCVVLGGDGTILRALRRYAGTTTPVFAVNFGDIGFLATIEPDDLAAGLRRAFEGEFELLRLPAIVLDAPSANGTTEERAFNDMAIHRKVGERVAELAYVLDGEELGSVRCDGLVVATPAGSTGYNLANGGPVMAWGVEGFVVSFIAPHSLTARTLVAAPRDRLEIHNRSREPLDVSVDGRPVGEIEPGGRISARFVDDAGTIAQLPGSSFYRRLRDKFGRLAR
ncbi:MAG TPA: NAD(+)/NADH kinase [Solirubrobacteraceae bacterium]|nr:NAD(+)/NADH kinase [Solirubrobacteraceae bacterium]